MEYRAVSKCPDDAHLAIRRYSAVLVDARRNSSLWPAFAICAVFFAFGLASLGDFGLTFDENESTLASQETWEVLSGRSEFSERHAIPGYYLAIDLSRELFARMVMLLSSLDRVLAEHLFNLLIATLSLAFVYQLALEIGNSRRTAALAAIALAAMPTFMAHSQNNPKDIPVLLAFPLTFWLLVRAVRAPSAGHTALAAVALGVSINTRTFSLILLPLFSLWLAGRWPTLAKSRLGQLAFIGVGAAIVAIALWPWLWLGDPFDQIQYTFEIIGNILKVNFPVLYLGDIQMWRQIPWHYLVFHMIATLPLSLLGLVCVSAIAASAKEGHGTRYRDLIWTGTLWVGCMIATDLLAPVRYDGMRHYLMILVGLALLIGASSDWLLSWLETRKPLGISDHNAKRIGWVIVAGAIGLAIFEGALIHPYQSAYLNPIASALGGEHTEQWIESEYWGHTFKEGAEWINEHTEPNAVVYVPFGEQVAAHYLERESQSRLTPSEFFDPTKPRYLMFITRRAMYEPIMHLAENRWQPVFEIQRQRATLLRIYSNTHSLRRAAADSKFKQRFQHVR